MQKALIRLSLFVPLLLLPSLLNAQEPAAPPTVPAQIDLQDGDTLVFLGDSITHQRLYTQYVEDFFYQRFPDRRIRFHNAGIGGAQAWDALARIGRDVLQYKPRYVTILLGMNDGRYQPFNQEIFARYKQDMTRLLDELRAGGSVPIVMSPTMFDARAARLRSNPRRPRSEETLSEYNSVLAYYGRWLQDRACEQGLSYVDMFGPLNDLTMEARETDASFTMIRDAVHPDPPGQIVMAYALIDDLGLRKPLSNIRIQTNGKGELRANASGGEVTDLQRTTTGLTFKWHADGLPWVVPEEATEGVELLKLGHRATKEGLEVHGIGPGRYDLLIDGEVVGSYWESALARHIELQNNTKTPQYQQALRVAMLNKQKNEGPVKELRDAWRLFQSWARMDRDLQSGELSGGAAEDTAKRAAAARKQLKSLEQKIVDAEAAAKKIEDEIYRVNQPEVRQFELRRTTTKRN